MTEELRILAARTLGAAGVRRLPVRLGAVAKQCNVQLFTYAEYAQAADTTVAEVAQRFGDDGFTQRFGEHIVVFYRESGNLRRMRWTVAHELAHVLLGHLDGNRQWDCPDRQADRLAAELLCPAAVVAACCCGSSRELAELCDISPTAARLVRVRSDPPIYGEELQLVENFGDFIAERQEKSGASEGDALVLPRLRSRRI